MNARQAKRIWERKYNVAVQVDKRDGEVTVLCYDDLTKQVKFQFVPAFDGQPTTWFDAETGKRIYRPGWIVRRLALEATKQLLWMDEIASVIETAKTRRPTKVLSSTYRDSKTAAHTTINGAGCIARLTKSR